MRNFLRILALISIVFTSLLFNVCNAADCSGAVIKSLPYKSIAVEHSNSETSMATWNNTSLEVSVTDKNDTYNVFSVGDVPIFNDYNNKISLLTKSHNIYIKSHNISSYLKNEICTRAP